MILNLALPLPCSETLDKVHSSIQQVFFLSTICQALRYVDIQWRTEVLSLLSEAFSLIEDTNVKQTHK